MKARVGAGAGRRAGARWAGAIAALAGPAEAHGLETPRLARAAHGVLVVAGGVALATAFPDLDWAGAAWVALAPVLLVAVRSRPAAAFGWGSLAGFAFFILLLRWLNYTFRVYSAIPWPLTWLPTMALAGYCALYVGLVAAAVAWITARRGPALALLAAPFLWVVAEWVRGHLFEGFPWGNLGYSQHRHLAVIQIAELGGVHAVSFVVLAVNAALAGAVALAARRAIAGLGLAAALVAATLGFGAWRLAEPQPGATLEVAVVQPSIDQPLKWDPDHVDETLRIYGHLTRQAVAGRPGLVVWPETASPTVLRRDPGLLGDLRALSAASGVPLLVGSIDLDDAGGAPRNSAFLVTGAGIAGRYDKIRLVPFGEYVPLAGVIGFVRGWADFISELEPGTHAMVFPGPPAEFGVVICYEGIFPDLVRRFARGGARFLVNMTNDGWFGRTHGPLQHLAMYPFRAVEHRAGVVRVANTGVSAFIEPSGRIAAHLGLYERGVLAGSVRLRWRETVYTRFGDWLAHLALVVSGGALLAAARGRT